MSIPTYSCYKFRPTNYDIITKLLRRKVNGEINETYEVKEENVYAVHPRDLNWNEIPGLYDHERYYFVKRKALASDQKQERKNASRVLENGKGFWKTANTKAVESFRVQGQVIGYVAHLNFYAYIDGFPKTVANSAPTTYLMHEFTLFGDLNDFEEWVVCRIKDKSRQNIPLMNAAQPRLLPALGANNPGYTGQPERPRQLSIEYDHHDGRNDAKLGRKRSKK